MWCSPWSHGYCHNQLVGDKGKVVAFEPHPKNAEILQKNIELNNLRNIILEQKAVGPRNGRIQITGESNSLIITKGTGLEVEMTTLDEYVDLNPIPKNRC